MLKTRRKTYGNTWWGQAWIEALERIDSNRLARGKSYANQGRVKNIKINNGNISASVKGSYYDSYSIKISLEKFTKDEIKKIKEIISQNSSIAIELGMGKLPETLLELIEKEKITLLPKRWKDLKSSCSCPDSANPCKHLAAVYYMLANEMDKDPFILFELKGIETSELTKLSGIEVQTKTIKINPIKEKFIESEKLEPKEITINIDEFEFSFPKYDIKSLLSLLPDNPPFYNEGNFKTFVENIYKVASQQLPFIISEIDKEPALQKNKFQIEFAKDPYSPKNLFKIKIIPDKENFVEDKQKIIDEITKSYNLNYKNSLIYDYDKNPPIFNIEKTILPVFDPKNKKSEIKGSKVISTIESKSVLDYFLSTTVNIDFDRASDSFAFLNILSSMVFGLVKANLFLPEIIFEADDAFTVRYIPLVKDSKIQEMIDKLKQIMPVDICNNKNKFLSQDGIVDLLSFFITYIVKSVLRDQNIANTDKIVTVFSHDYLFKACNFAEKNIAQSIFNWLEKLYISKKDISPLVRIESSTGENFKVFVDIVNRKNSLDPIIQYKELFKESKSKKTKQTQEFFLLPADKVRAEVANQLIIAGEYFKELKDIVDTKGETAPIISIQKISEIFLKTADIFNVLGIEIIFPKELKKLAFPNLQAKAKLKKFNETGESYLNLHEMLNFSYEIALGDEAICLKDFRKLVKETQGLIKYKDQYVLLKPEEMQNILNKLKEPIPEMTSSMQALYTAVTGEINGIRFEADGALKRVLDDFTKIEEVLVPENLNATLRPYQERGFKWLYSNAKKQFGSCIADDMGLGKTIQVITLLLQYKNENKKLKPSLVICPTTLIGNWEKECRKFAPSLNLNIYHGTERQLDLKNIDVLITSYGIFRRDLKKFSSKDWNFLIIDEAQNIKNAETAQTKAVKSLKTDNYIAMTGTPVENRLTELWNIFDFINKGYMGSLTQFKTELATPIEKYKDRDIIEKFKKATSPFILRRLKTDKSIISDLPDKISFDEYCYLTKEQAAVYQNVVEDIMKQVEDSDGIQRKGLIFKLINSLKQICNHPAHFVNKGNIDSELSGKASKAISIIENLLDNREKALIFTQYRKMGDILQEIIKKELKEEAIFFHGGVTRKKRDEMVNSFQNERKIRLMIISLKAGGTGLNLTEASNVIHYDLWWNPAVENQATDRAYRIGQNKNVIVHRLITLGTFEEKIDEIIKSKKELADLTVSTGESWITEMSNKDLREIFTLYKYARN
ncbi:MAG: DEAD/DEAH box helicase [bacterium]